MFCTNCGKEIGEVKFCSYCGAPVKTAKKSNESAQSRLQEFRENVRIYGHARITNIISVVCAVLAILIRWTNTAEEIGWVTAVGLGTFYVISEQGKTWLTYLIALQVVSSGVVLLDAKKADIGIPKSTWFFAIATLAIEILAIKLRLSF